MAHKASLLFVDTNSNPKIIANEKASICYDPKALDSRKIIPT